MKRVFAGKDLLIPPHEPMVDAPGTTYKRRKIRGRSPWSPTAPEPHRERNITLFFAGALLSRGKMPFNGRGHLKSAHYYQRRPGWVLLDSKGVFFQTHARRWILPTQTVEQPGNVSLSAYRV